MSIYLDLLKNKIGYTDKQYNVTDVKFKLRDDEESKINIDKFSSIDIHEKSKESIVNLKNFFNSRWC